MTRTAAATPRHAIVTNKDPKAFLLCRIDQNALSSNTVLTGMPVNDGEPLAWTRIDSRQLLLVLSPVDVDLLNSSFSRFVDIARECKLDSEGVVILIPRRAPPIDVRRFDGHASSMLLTGATWNRLGSHLSNVSPQLWCYEVLHSLMNTDVQVGTLLVRELTATHAQSAAKSLTRITPRVDAIIPHRGPDLYLRRAYSSLYNQTAQAPYKIGIGLDLEDLHHYTDLIANERVIACHSRTPPVGPYVLRQHLIEQSTSEYVMLLDSDDMASSDRVVAQLDALNSARAQMVGCHEIEVNELDRTVRLYRFPLDVTSILAEEESDGIHACAAEPILHATALFDRAAFLRTGGFSTDRPIANDSQLLLRAHFSLRIANADVFGYFRRVHAKALTIAPATRNGNALRQELSSRWSSDFRQIKRKQLSLESSSLIVQRGGAAICML